jgi:antirestriction protein ArdC
MNVYEIITDKILDMLKSGNVPWKCTWARNLPKNLVSKKPYRGINLMLLACSAYPSEYWLTYKQAQEKGGNVKKGEKGTPIVFWKIGKRTDDEGNERKTFILRYYTVFNASQCEGIKLPESPESKPEFNPISACENTVAGYNDPPVI